MEVINTVLDALYSAWNQFFYAIVNIRIFDAIDILIVAFIIYKAIEFLRETSAGQLVKGIVILLVVFAIANLFNLVSIKWILTNVLDYAIIALAIIFQPELRRLLEKVGTSNISIIGKQSYSAENERIKECIDAVCKAVTVMSDKRIGALIVFERKSSLTEIVNTGTVLNADTSYEIIGNIFFPKSPLHDGALIIKNGSIRAAGCILPLTANNKINSQLGTRHRAAIGVSEKSDAVALIVSEETGNISLAVNGRITRDYNSVTLKEELYLSLLNKEETKKSFVSELIGKLTKK